MEPMYSPSYDAHNNHKHQPVLTTVNYWTAVSLHYCTVQSDRWLQTFRRNLIPNQNLFLPLILRIPHNISLLSIPVNTTQPQKLENKDIKMTVKTDQLYYNLLFQGYMFRLLRFIMRSSNEPIQDYLISSALWDPVTLTIVGVIVL